MSSDPVACIEVSVADVTEKTRWIFVEIETTRGVRGVGEATLGGQENAVVEAVRRLTPMLLALPDAVPRDAGSIELTCLADAAACSAIDQALWDILAQRRGVPLAEALGSVGRDRIPVYANINRRTRDRSPSGFAASARDALAAGHAAIKIAPFDEVNPASASGSASQGPIEPGLSRIAAVREAIGPERRLMVDCHWRLDEGSAEQVIRRAAELGVHWVECPLPETAANLSSLARLRHMANERGVLLAGCEQGIRLDGFAPFIDAAVYDVMMPDVKYVGGLSEILRLASHMAQAGIAFSPHNPSGPVCHAVSLQVSAVVGALHSLEMQFDETPLFDALADSVFAPVVAGAMALPSGPGIGTRLDSATLARLRTTHWTATR